MLGISIFGFGVVWWLGLYVLARGPCRRYLWVVSATHLGFAGVMVCDVLYRHTLLSSDVLLATQRWLAAAVFPLMLAASTILPPPPSQQVRLQWALFGGLMLYLPGLLGLWLASPLATVALWVCWAGVLVFGGAVTALDAVRRGVRLLPDLLRSMDYAFFTAVLFASQVGLVMALHTGVTLPLVLLLLQIVAVAVAVQVFAGPAQHLVDQVAFGVFPEVLTQREAARVQQRALLHMPDRLDVAAMTPDEFARHTRRAFSDFGDLTRLAASPLTRLGIVAAHLEPDASVATSLDRAATLKLILAESVDRLRPPGPEMFGTSDEWRYYNALYFPYIVGLKPFSRRATHDALDPIAQQALVWFQGQVPERTLYNWQKAAAGLVAQDLREQEAALLGDTP